LYDLSEAQAILYDPHRKSDNLILLQTTQQYATVIYIMMCH